MLAVKLAGELDAILTEDKMKRLNWFVVTLFLFSTIALGQGYDRNRGKTTARMNPDAKAQFQVDAFSFGAGTFFGDTGISFSAESLFVELQFHGVALPFIKTGTSTGIALEGHLAKMFGRNTWKNLQTLQFSEMSWRIWSITRVPLSAVPVKSLQSGTPSRVFAGTDLLVAEGGPVDYTGGFDARFVLGGDLGVIGPGNLVLEVYMFEQNKPVYFAMIYGF